MIGTLTRLDGIARPVDVWLPPGYADQLKRRYPVIYMHDGQNLFDPKLSPTGIAWEVDAALGKLGRAAIVVAIWSDSRRRPEYMPQCAVTTPAQAQAFVAAHGDAPFSDRYLHFITAELKPVIDAAYRTRPERAQTLVMGASMGGLISLYAVCAYPEVFGGAACLSTHWVIGGNALVDALADRLPPPGHHRLYFDYGTESLDAGYEPFQQRMDARLRAAGYRVGADWLTRKFPGADHCERAWRDRVAIPLGFLLE
jgi:predicted alpha/beta superfamily hydrolase